MSTISQWCRYCGVENRPNAKTCYFCARPIGAPNQRQEVPQQQQQNVASQQSGSRTMNWRSHRFLVLLLLICIVLVVSVGSWIGMYLINRPQIQSTPSNQWVQIPSPKPGQPQPTSPAGTFLFKNATGGFVVYYPPTTPPASITWMAFRNIQDGYSINYPSNWMKIENSSDGHTDLALYPPGTDLKEDVPGGPKGISLRWNKTYQPPISTDSTITDIKSITIDGVTGQLYTQGALGVVIIATFPYKGGDLLLIADADSNVLVYVFQHILASLKFT